MNEFVALGFDGGGSHCRAALVSPQGKILGVGTAGPANIKSVGLGNAVESLHQAVTRAWDHCDFAKRRAAAAFLGLAGAGSPEDRDLLTQAAIEAGMAAPGCVWADHDLRIALAGALGGAAGIVIAAGTGSAAYGRTEDGHSWQAGGWGWLMDDPGSGYWLGRRALRAAVEEADERGKPTSLTNLIIEQMGLNSIRDITEKLYGPKKAPAPIQKIVGLAPLVTSAANEGDPVARRILSEGCSELVRMAQAVARKLDWTNAPIPVSAIGGVARSGNYFVSTLESALAEVLPEAVLRQPMLPPVLGAVYLALQKSGQKFSPDFIAALSSQPEAAGLW